MDIPEDTLVAWLDSLKVSAAGLYKDSRLNSGLTKVEMQSEAEGIESAIYYLSKKIQELKHDNTNQ